MPQPVRPTAFTGASAVFAILALRAGNPAASLAFSPSPTTNGSVDHVDHHRLSAGGGSNGDRGRGGGGHWSPVRLRRGRGRGPSLFSRLKASSPPSSPSDSLFGRGGARGLGSGSGSGSSGGIGEQRHEGGGVLDTIKCSATAEAAAAGVFKEDEPFILERVKNIRDLSSVEGYGIAPGRVFRTGHLSAATVRDAKMLRDCTGLRTLVSEKRGRSHRLRGFSAYAVFSLLLLSVFVGWPLLRHV